jgi:hypothetical protein
MKKAKLGNENALKLWPTLIMYENMIYDPTVVEVTNMYNTVK